MIIHGIDDLLPALEGRSEFIVVDKGDYTFIDYVFQTEESFEDPRRLECRGIKFDRNGKILARPFHKFFNVGERQQPHEIDLHRPHVLMEKLDGSMIHPVRIDGAMHLMTRKGVTDVAKQAENLFLRQNNYFTCMNDLLGAGYTPIFEYTGPNNRIVIRYDEPRLTLLAVRDMNTGVYFDRDTLRTVSDYHNIPLVGDVALSQPIDDHSIRNLLAATRILEDKEGYVLMFEDGHMLKMKADDYLRKHRALDDMSSRKKVLALVLSGFEDDVIPMLDAADAQELREFAAQVNAEVTDAAERVAHFVNGAKVTGLSRKEFATGVVVAAKGMYGDWIGPALFRVYDGDDPQATVRQTLMRNNEAVKATWRGQ